MKTEQDLLNQFFEERFYDVQIQDFDKLEKFKKDVSKTLSFKFYVLNKRLTELKDSFKNIFK